IFVPSGDMDCCQQHFEGMPPRAYGGETAVAGFFPVLNLPERLRAQRYDVLHNTALDLTSLSYERSRFADRVFPLTCSQHGISYSFQIDTRFVPLLMAQIYPCDAIVCLTQASRRAMEKRLQGIAESYSRAWGKPMPCMPRLEVIPWGIDTQRFAPRDRPVARQDLGLPQDRPIIL